MQKYLIDTQTKSETCMLLSITKHLVFNNARKPIVSTVRIVQKLDVGPFVFWWA